MIRLKPALAKGALFVAVTAAALAVTATMASADVVCNRAGECWKVKEHYNNYPANLRAVFHDDAWAAKHQNKRYHWQKDQPDDHGYYDHGVWHPF